MMFVKLGFSTQLNTKPFKKLQTAPWITPFHFSQHAYFNTVLFSHQNEDYESSVLSFSHILHFLLNLECSLQKQSSYSLLPQSLPPKNSHLRFMSSIPPKNLSKMVPSCLHVLPPSALHDQLHATASTSQLYLRAVAISKSSSCLMIFKPIHPSSVHKCTPCAPQDHLHTARAPSCCYSTIILFVPQAEEPPSKSLFFQEVSW